MKTKLMIGVLMSLTVMHVSAHDFSVTINKQRLYFDITSTSKRTASVTYNGSIKDKKILSISGEIEIPDRVKHDNVVYEVNEIGAKAFSNAKHLKKIVIPSNVKRIGDFAFEACDSLEKVVFPGNIITFGQGVFFKCSQITDVSIGSDWKEIDFTMFRWSKKLTSVTVPAKIEKIRGLKKLNYLNTINVDPNNVNFSSFNGVLYNKKGNILYACPRAYMEKLVVMEGTEKVFEGALVDCVDIEYIDLPMTLQSISFKETSNMRNLNTIIMRPVTPILTGYLKGNGFFMFQLCNPKTEIIVLSSAKNKYIDALANDAGEYSDNNKDIPYTVKQDELPTKKNIKGVKNFNKYNL